MTAHALCPLCARTLPVRTDERLPRHWKSERDTRARLTGEPQCKGSELYTLQWPTYRIGSRTVRIKRPRRSKR